MRFLLMLGGEGPQPTYRARYNYVVRGLIEAGMIEMVEASGEARLTDLGRRFMAIS